MKDAKITKKGREKAQRQLAAKLRSTALQKARTLVPVDEGDLKDSLQVSELSDYSLILGSDLDYAGLVENGTVDMEPQPFIRPAMRRLKRQ